MNGRHFLAIGLSLASFCPAVWAVIEVRVAVTRQQDAPTRETVSAELAKQCNSIAANEAEFLDQLQLSIANRAFESARKASEGLLDTNGNPVQSQVDQFHNYLDEFVRGLTQFETGTMPATNSYGKAAIEAAKRLKEPMSDSDLREAAERIKRQLEKLKVTANKTPGLGDVSHLEIKQLTTPEFAVYTSRTVANIEVLVGNCGLGPVYSPANAEADPLRASLVKLVQAANGLLERDVAPDSDVWKLVEDCLKQSIDCAKVLGRNAPAWKQPELGSRGPLAVSALENLRKAYGGVKSRRSKK